MSFDDRTLRKDDSPKTRVQLKYPQYKCVKVFNNAFVITDGTNHLCEDVSAYEAWRSAECILIHEPDRKRRIEKLNR